MSKADAMNTERMDPQFHREMVDLGWRLPQTEAEVRAAEDFVAEQPEGLPERLRDDVELPTADGAAPRPESLLARYLREGGADSGPRDRGRDAPPKGRNLDRS